MFTGIVRELGALRRIDNRGNVYRLEISCAGTYGAAGEGDSVCVNGVCLTVTAKASGALVFDVMAETARRTTLARLGSNERVNLESALKAGGSLDGHFVLGHVDCVAAVAGISRKGDEHTIDVDCPAGFSHLLVEKGSVAIDGVSLTVGDTSGNSFRAYLIPFTLKSTTLGSKRAGSLVNIEFDVIGKYVSKLASAIRPGVTENYLKEHGF